MNLTERLRSNEDLIHLAQGGILWQVIKSRNFLNSSATICFSRKTVLHRIDWLRRMIMIMKLTAARCIYESWVTVRPFVRLSDRLPACMCFLLGLFNFAFNCSYYKRGVELGYRMLHQSWTGKDMEGNDRGLILSTISVLVYSDFVLCDPL